jgi:hypothetical protein
VPLLQVGSLAVVLAGSAVLARRERSSREDVAFPLGVVDQPGS